MRLHPLHSHSLSISLSVPMSDQIHSDNVASSHAASPEEDVNPAMGSTNDDGKYIPQVSTSVLPYFGQKFSSSEDALAFYNGYAKEAGFSVRSHNNRKNEDGSGYRWRQFTCSKQGKTNQRYQEKVKNTKPRSGERKRKRTRCGCLASLTVTKPKKADGWIVSKFEPMHNHPLTSLGNVHFLKSHRKVSTIEKNLASQYSEANIPTSQQFPLMEIEFGGPSTVGCLEEDIRNCESDMRREFLGHDAESLIAFFEIEKQRDDNFYYDYKIESGAFNRCFWADRESCSAYLYFGDVVAFNTTYNTNKYGMIFAHFVGVNHHMQTVVFGCGLLRDEGRDSFIWLFSQFLAAMPDGVMPKVIITDQDQAIVGVVSEVFPPTVHCLCLWHITNKFSEKLGPLLYGDYKNVLDGIVNQSETPKEFEKRWGDLMSTTELGGNEWLRSIYAIRDRWAPAYVKHMFIAGMSSSQRVEVQESFLKSCVIRENSLMDFITRYRRAIAHQRHEELLADHIDKKELPRTLTSFHIENQMVGIYTKAVFLLFQDELQQSVSYDCSKISTTTDAKVYQLVRFDANSDHPRQITWWTTSNIITCNCKLFEFSGYPCRHILCLMYRKHIRTLADHYILNRWTKEAKSNPVFNTTLEFDASQSFISRRATLAKEVMELVDEASLTQDCSNFALRGVRDLKKQAREINNERRLAINRKRSMSHEEILIIRDPILVRADGCSST